MSKLIFKFENLKEIKIDISKLTPEIKKEVGQLTKDTGRQIADQSKRNLTQNKSVVTGNLRRSMTSIYYDKDLGSEVGTNVTYAPFVEFGTRYSKAKPYLAPAWNKFINIYHRQLYQLLKVIMPRG